MRLIHCFYALLIRWVEKEVSLHDADSLFFMLDLNYRVTPANFCMISLNKNDRLRLINCNEMIDSIRETIKTNYGELQREADKYGSWEFKLTGYPWNCIGDAATLSRRLIARISDTMHGATKSAIILRVSEQVGVDITLT